MYRWSFVFPLGMYSAASHAFARADVVESADDLGRVFFALAVAMWVLALLGLCRRAVRGGRPAQSV